MKKAWMIWQVAALGFVLAGIGQAQAQKFGEDADFSMWCIAAMDVMEEKGLLPDVITDAVLDSAYDRHEKIVDADIAKLGMSDDTLAMMRRSYLDEAGMQIPDWAMSRDAAALRYDLDRCFIAD